MGRGDKRASNFPEFLDGLKYSVSAIAIQSSRELESRGKRFEVSGLPSQDVD
jgi:hypothetical protein